MIELKDDVCNKELAERIKELGVKQDSIWYWCRKPDGKYYITSYIYVDKYVDKYSAFTVAELGKLLPSIIYDKVQKEYNLRIYKYGKTWNIAYEWDDGYDGGTILKYVADISEADARAKMLIYLLEDKLIKLEDVNER